MGSLNNKILEIACTQIGVKEDRAHKNWGPEVKMYLAAVGLTFPASWCMAYVFWCVAQACKELNMPNPLVRTGGVMEQWHKIDLRYKTNTPVPGAIMILDFKNGHGHTGFAEIVPQPVVLATGRYHTIEGNSNTNGSADGYEVCRPHEDVGGRLISHAAGFINLEAGMNIS